MENIKFTRCTITCMEFVNSNGESSYQWVRNDGALCSPVLKSKEQAMEFPNNHPLIPVDELDNSRLFSDS